MNQSTLDIAKLTPPHPDLAEIQDYVDQWSLATETDRIKKRTGSTLEELTAFYEAVLPRLREIILFLDQFPLKQIPAAYLPLTYVALSMIEVDQAVNKWKSPILPEAVDPSTYIIKKDFYDTAPMTGTDQC